MSKCSYISEENCYEIIPERSNITLRELLLSLDTDFGIPYFCGGNGLCGKCVVHVHGGVAPPDGSEKSFLSKKQLKEGFRLACRVRLTGEKVYVSCKTSVAAEYEDKNSIHSILTTKGMGGVAVDVGTTTIAVYLLTEDGSVLKKGFLNPLQRYGSDVISIMDSVEKKSATLEEMQKKLVRVIEETVAELIDNSNASYSDIYEIVIAGNTVMEHIICGLNPCGMVSYPYLPKSLFGTSYLSDSLWFEKIHNVEVYAMPCISSFVGGDITAGMLASGILPINGDERECSAVLYIDIGTNGEIVLCNENKLYACSCAAGPAFEGANIECGTIYRPGAVESVCLARQMQKVKKNHTFSNVEFEYKTANNCPADGICGSGIIDATAVMLDIGLIDETGKMLVAEKRIYIDREKKVYITSQDIRNIQLAKSAIVTGIKILLRHAGISVDNIGKVLLAGGFGSKLNRHSLCRIGAIPSELEEKIILLGNMSGEGALMCIGNRHSKKIVCQVAKSVRHIELSDEKDFSDIFADNMFFS